MSWRIYNGFKLKNITTLEEALAFSKSLIIPFEKLADEHWKKLIISYAISEYDNDSIDNIRATKNYIKGSMNVMQEQEMSAIKDNRKSFTDVSMSLSMAPVMIGKKPSIIGMLFCDNKDMQDAFYTLDTVEEYQYYDNADEPDDISPAKWKARKKVWESLFEEYTTASKVTFNFDVISQKESMRFPQFSEEDIAKYATTWEDRVKGALNYHILKDKNFKELNEYTKFVRSDEASDMKKASRYTIEHRIKKTITLTDLKGQ